MALRTPKVYVKTVTAEWAECDIVGDYGRAAKFVQLSNFDESQAVSVRLNGDSEAVFTLSGNSSQVFNSGDATITKIEMAIPSSGEGSAVCEVIISY